MSENDHPPPHPPPTDHAHPTRQEIPPRNDGPTLAATSQPPTQSNPHRQATTRNPQHSRPSSTQPLPSSHTLSPDSFLESSPDQTNRDSVSPDSPWAHGTGSTTSSGSFYEGSTTPIAPDHRGAPLVPNSSYGSLSDTSVRSESLADLPAFSRQVTPFNLSSSYNLHLDSLFPSHGGQSSSKGGPHDFASSHNFAAEYSGQAYEDQTSNVTAFHGSALSDQGPYYAPSRFFETRNSDAAALREPGSNYIFPSLILHSLRESRTLEAAFPQENASSHVPLPSHPNSHGGHIASIDTIRGHSSTYMFPSPVPDPLYAHGCLNINVANSPKPDSAYVYSSHASARSYGSQNATVGAPSETTSDYISSFPDTRISYDGKSNAGEHSSRHPSRYAPSYSAAPSHDSRYIGTPTAPGSSSNCTYPSHAPRLSHGGQISSAGTPVGPSSSYVPRPHIPGSRYGEQAPGISNQRASLSRCRQTGHLRPMSADISQFNAPSSSSKSNSSTSRQEQRYHGSSRQQEPQGMMQAMPQSAPSPAETFPGVDRSFEFLYYVPRRTQDEIPMPHYDSLWLPSASAFTNGPSEARPSEFVEKPTKKRKTEQGPRFSCKLPGCNKTFVNEITSIRHMKETGIHGAEKKHKCSFCDIRFARVDACRRHEKAIHADELEAEMATKTADDKDEGKRKSQDKGKGKAKDN